MKILVVGGGTAGWLTSLFLNKTFPEHKIELIESEQVGILGAGESTTIPFFELLRYLDINENEFLKKTKSTFKSLVRFNDWNIQQSSFVSPMYPSCLPLSPEYFGGNTSEYFIYCAVNNIKINERGYPKLSSNNKSPFALVNGEKVNVGGYTYQINAKLTAQYFRTIAEKRGVIRHEGKIVKVNGHHPITSVEDDKGIIHSFDFVIDCSGFARLLIGKHYQEKWNDYTKHLTVDSAIPFFLEMDEEIPPYTSATAMTNGWMFKVPTQERYGSGYVFDSSKIDAEQAKKEVEKKLGYEVNLVNNFKFKAGVFEKSWISNCLSFGLASGFLEPMSATNIGIMIFLFEYLKTIKGFKYSEYNIVEFNRLSKEYSENFSCLIYLHYMNNQMDNSFWNHYRQLENAPTKLQKSLEDFFFNNKFDILDFAHSINQNPNKIITVLTGNKMFEENYKKYYQIANLENRYGEIDKRIMETTNFLMDKCIDHREYLEKYCN